jgi:LPS-assembly lipoprotein
VRRAVLKSLMCLSMLVGLAGCGFQLRGQAQLPFESAYVEATRASQLAEALRQSLSSQDKLASRPEGAPVRITLADESRTKSILSLSGSGKVKEYRIVYKVRLLVTDASGKELIAPSDILLTHDYSYSDTEVLAKEAEQAYLNRAMVQDALQQILRSLSYVKR